MKRLWLFKLDITHDYRFVMDASAEAANSEAPMKKVLELAKKVNITGYSLRNMEAYN